jgi:hypothetical protein
MLALALGLAGTLWAQDTGLYLRYGAWNSSTSGEISSSGTAADIGSDLGVNKDKPTAYGIVYRGNSQRFGLEIFDSSASATVTLDAPLDFGGRHFDAGSTVRTGLKIKTADVEFWQPLTAVPTMRTSLVMSLQRVEMRGSVEDAVLKNDDIIPAFGLGVTFLTPQSKMYVDFVVMGGEYKGASRYGGRLETGVDVTANIGLYLGLKQEKLDLKDNKTAVFSTDTGSFYIGAHLHL